MDYETRTAISTLWKRGIEPLQGQVKDVSKQVDALRDDMQEQFEKLGSRNRWFITQVITTGGIVVAIVFDILSRTGK